MEYRGIEYAVVRTMSPNGWRWSVKRERSDKIGTAPDRAGAIVRAQRFIDELIRERGLEGGGSV